MNNYSLIIVKYTTREYIKKFLIFLIGFFLILFAARLLESLRVYASKDIPFYVILKIAFNRAPYVLQRILPLIILFATINLITNLNKQNELVILKSFGVSMWQFMAPFLITAFLLGVAFISILNPVIATMYNLSQDYEKKYFEITTNLISITPSDIWFKEEGYKEKKIIRAKYLSNNGTTLNLITIYIFDNKMNLQYRINAQKAEIVAENVLKCYKGYKFIEGELPYLFDELEINTYINPEGLQEGFLPPGSISFWELTSYIQLFKRAGFSALKHQLYFISILAIPFQMMVYAMIGIISSFNLIRNNRFYLKVLGGVVGGLVYFLVHEIIMVIALNSTVSPYFIILMPMIVISLILVYLILYIEES